MASVNGTGLRTKGNNVRPDSTAKRRIIVLTLTPSSSAQSDKFHWVWIVNADELQCFLYHC